jgi:hypothetical protein
LNNTLTNADIADGTVRTNEITNDTITEDDISDAFVARSASIVNTFDVRDLSANTSSATSYDPLPIDISDKAVSSFFST